MWVVVVLSEYFVVVRLKVMAVARMADHRDLRATAVVYSTFTLRSQGPALPHGRRNDGTGPSNSH